MSIEELERAIVIDAAAAAPRRNGKWAQQLAYDNPLPRGRYRRLRLAE
jgi:hypothetical protein